MMVKHRVLAKRAMQGCSALLGILNESPITLLFLGCKQRWGGFQAFELSSEK